MSYILQCFYVKNTVEDQNRTIKHWSVDLKCSRIDTMDQNAMDAQLQHIRILEIFLKFFWIRVNQNCVNIERTCSFHIAWAFDSDFYLVVIIIFFCLYTTVKVIKFFCNGSAVEVTKSKTKIWVSSAPRRVDQKQERTCWWFWSYSELCWNARRWKFRIINK